MTSTQVDNIFISTERRHINVRFYVDSLVLVRIENVYLSTSSRATMSPFFRALIANISPVLLYSASNTCRGEAEEHNTAQGN